MVSQIQPLEPVPPTIAQSAQFPRPPAFDNGAIYPPGSSSSFPSNPIYQPTYPYRGGPIYSSPYNLPNVPPYYAVPNNVIQPPPINNNGPGIVDQPNFLIPGQNIIEESNLNIPQIENPEKNKGAQEAGEETEPTKEESTCVICLDAVPEAVIVDCGHLCVCMACTKGLHKCPMCRKDIIQIIKVFKV
jgi:hypothetical protein